MNATTSDHEAIARLDALIQSQRAAFLHELRPSATQRIAWLKQLEQMVLRNQDRIAEAIAADFGTHAPALTRITELLGPVGRARYARKQVRRWMSPQSRPIDRVLFGLARNELRPQPVGLVGNMSPWNFPFDISFGPLADTLAAGCRTVIKPSEHVPESAALIEELVTEFFDPDVVAVVRGGVELAKAFAARPGDHLLFTGGPEIAKEVMRAAAEHLTPVTLELGGKNPTVVAPDKIDLATARTIVATKMVKAGQMCITTDYVFVPRDRMDDFVDLAQQAMRGLYPRAIDNPDSTSIIDQRHFDRLESWVKEAEAAGATVVPLDPAGEEMDREGRKLPLYLVLDPSDELQLMRHEIFGPILPVKPYDDLDEVLAYINARPRPLALYVFSGRSAIVDRIVDGTVSGGVAVNAVALHAMQPTLPFGGTGRSGMGHHHGYEGFLTFSKMKPVFRQFPINGSSLLYPPYGAAVKRLLDFLLPRH
ncbi:MAG: coniferyl aldehyde dehydrogenase [Myxococcota bacterium]